MRKTSKLLALVLAVLMMFSIASVSVSAQFSDVSVDDEALNDAVNLLTTLKIAYGTTDTTFAPNENVTRQQMAAFVYRLMKAGKQVTGGTNATKFTDLDDATFYYMVSWASENNIIKGTSATTFNPKGGITLQDAYVMLVRALGYEKESTLPYPIGFIDVAEDIGLDEDLPSTLQYTDTLTRGNVAIILANAFYADMNETTTKNEWIEKKYTEGGVEKSTWAYMPTEVTETVAHKIFGVVEETFNVYATTHYGFGTEALYNDKNDVDRITGIRYDENGDTINNGRLVTIEMDDLGLSGSSDDYFLAELTLFVKKDSSDFTKDKFLAAKSNLIKKTATAADVVLETSTKTDKEYYVGGVKDKSADKVMTGYATFAGTKAYLDKENAPYSYTDVDKKDAVKFIEMTSGSYEKDGNSSFVYGAVRDVDFDGDYDDTTNGTNGSHDYLTKQFEAKFPRIYNKGLYELDVYDIDGDGYAEYVMEKPYTFAKVEVKKNKDYKGLTGSSFPKTFNTESAVIEGTYADKDYVLAYMPGASIPYVEIKEVVKPVESMVVSKKNSDDSKTITLKSGEVVEFEDAAKKLINYNNYTIAGIGAGKSYKMYIKDGVLLYSDNISSDGFDAAANYAIIIKYDDANATKYRLDNKETYSSTPRVVYDATGVSNGEFKTYLYVNAVMGGAVKAVKLADYAYTHIDYNDTTKTYTKTSDVDSLKITDKTVAETVLFEDFLGKFATYTVDGDSAYTFTALDIEDNAANYAKIFADKDNEDSIVYYGDKISMKHYTGAIYSITSEKIGGMSRFNVKDYTKVIIKTVDDDNEDVYTEYTASTLPKFDTTQFNNVKAIFVNNKSSNIENLGILYAEIDEFGSSGSKDYRIVTAVETVLNSNNKETQKATVLDPKTGTTTSAEPVSGFTAVAGKLVEMQEDGKVKKVTVGDSYADGKIFSATFADYDADNKFMTLDKDSHTYIVDDSTTILYYTKTSEYEMTDTDILATGSDNSIMDLEEGKSFRVYVVAVDGDDKDNTDIVKVKTIIALDPIAAELK